MQLSVFAQSNAFFEFSSENLDPKLADFQSFRGRIHCLVALLDVLSILPFALFYKFCKTLLRASSLAFSAVLLISTIGISSGLRDFFVRRVSYLARDLADWVIYPFALITCFSKLLLASLVHPALHLRFH